MKTEKVIRTELDFITNYIKDALKADWDEYTSYDIRLSLMEYDTLRWVLSDNMKLPVSADKLSQEVTDRVLDYEVARLK